MSDAPLKKDTYEPGDIIALPRSQRKVGLVLGPSKLAGKIRIVVWRHASKCWTNPQVCDMSWPLGLAPMDWPQTRAIRKHGATESALRAQGRDTDTMAVQGAMIASLKSRPQGLAGISDEQKASLQAFNQALTTAFFGKRGGR